jgi:(p)ppGpp synthase/HD superfamily hydrolase
VHPLPIGDAFLNLGGGMVVSATMGGLIIFGVHSMWDKIEPWFFSNNNPSNDKVAGSQEETLYGVDVSGSKFFPRERVKQAVEFAASAHEGQVRKTRQPYVSHCIETASIVESLLSPNEEDERAEAAVIAALLHDVLDDAGIDPQDVYEKFGDHVGSMVTKVSQLSATNQLVRRRLRLEHAKQTKSEMDNLRAMIVTMVSEPLVIVIKLADRLHNMRTVYALAPDKQRAVAEETQRIWCSLAERLGMFAIKSELEDLCFAVLQPATYGALKAEVDEIWGVEKIPESAMNPMANDHAQYLPSDCSIGDDPDHPVPGWLGSSNASIPEMLQENSTEHDPEAEFLTEDQIEVRDLINTVLPFDATTFNMEKLRITPTARRGLEVLQRCAKALLQEITTEGVAIGLDISVHGRVKSLFSSFKKMARKGVPLREVYDVRALRVVVDDVRGVAEREAIEACYKVLPAVHRLWRKVPGEDDDYIAVPKPSGYQSLHTAVIGPGGVPMEVQIRTATMHDEAEYGKAAHWAYKEKPIGGYSSGEIKPELIGAGHPVLRISPSGRLRDAVVISSESHGKRLLVAVSHSIKNLENNGVLAAQPEVYEKLYEYVLDKGYFTASQGDMGTTLELFTLCSDGKYHRLDRFGHKLPTTVVPLQSLDAMKSLALASRSALTAQRNQDPAAAFMNTRIKLLRSMIEWGVDVEDDTRQTEDEDPLLNDVTNSPASEIDVMVLIWPSGKIMRLPRGTTAGWVVDCHDSMGQMHHHEKHADSVNVNNCLVHKDTMLQDGDYVVLTNESLKV